MRCRLHRMWGSWCTIVWLDLDLDLAIGHEIFKVKVRTLTSIILKTAAATGIKFRVLIVLYNLYQRLKAVCCDLYRSGRGPLRKRRVFVIFLENPLIQTFRFLVCYVGQLSLSYGRKKIRGLQVTF